MEYCVLAFYHYVSLDEPEKLVQAHRDFLERLDVKARIYISEEGINGQMSASKEAADLYIDWLHANPLFKAVDFKLDFCQEHVFPRLSIKKRPLLGISVNICPSKRGRYMSPKEWRKALDNRTKDTVLIDVRNNYESKIGHFEGAICPPLESFRDFKRYAEDLQGRVDVGKAQIMMYCTGGIRCELYSSLLLSLGFLDVSQLRGGIIKYGHEEGSVHWRGKLFVFDDRLVVPIHPNAKEDIITECAFCGKPYDFYRNCANMDCNSFLLSCEACTESNKGCCSEQCLREGRVRDFQKGRHPKPFCRLSKGNIRKNVC